MSGRVVVTGLTELIQALQHASDGARTEGMQIVREETEGAAAEIRQALPRKTGDMVSRVQTTYPSSTVLVGIVRSASPHSHLVEFGTRQRRTASGANRGAMPKANPQITPVIAAKHRTRMYERLMEMLRRTGLFEVTQS